MPVSFEMPPTARRCTIRFSGILTVDDAKASLELQIKGGSWERGALLDASGVSGIRVQFLDVREYAEYAAARAKTLPVRGPVAAAAPQDLVFGIMRMYQQWMEPTQPWNLYVARSIPEAEEWLARFDR